jgi:acetyl esterase/lipase
VRAAYDTLIAQAASRGLDPTRIVLAGHSAGGHLALWLASEPGVRVRGVLSLAGITDLAAFASPSGCGAAVPLLMGGTSADRPDPYLLRSPVSRPAASGAVTVITAEGDRTVPAAQSDAYLARFPAATRVVVPGGHFDLVAPWSEAWPPIMRALRAMNP